MEAKEIVESVNTGIRQAIKEASNESAILARLDERTDNMQRSFCDMRTWMRSHEAKDDKRFDQVFSKINGQGRLIWIGVGIVIASQVIIVVVAQYLRAIA